jgi:hypothetical protein
VSGRNRRPAYSRVVKALDNVMDMNMGAHNGNPPSWDQNCAKCQVVREARDVLERAKSWKRSQTTAVKR